MQCAQNEKTVAIGTSRLMQLAEQEIRAWLIESTPIGDAMTGLFESYTYKSQVEKDAFVAVLIGRVTAAEGLRRARAM